MGRYTDLFAATPRGGRVEATGGGALHMVAPAGAAALIDLATLSSIGLLFVGDGTSPVSEGWWLFGRPDDAVAVLVDCPHVDLPKR